MRSGAELRGLTYIAQIPVPVPMSRTLWLRLLVGAVVVLRVEYTLGQ
jgi:hypothetical protein